MEPGAAGIAPPAKKAATQALLPGASAPPAAAAAAGAAGGASVSSAAFKAKRTALVKGLLTSLKAAAKAKRWHRGDDETLTCSVVLDAADFGAQNADMDARYRAGTVGLDEFANFYVGTLAGRSPQDWEPLRQRFLHDVIVPRIPPSAMALVQLKVSTMNKQRQGDLMK
jgi:hypothetical protein